MITWAVGHLVQLAEPEEYDEKWKKWRMADLPIFPPDGFKLVPRDAKSKKQLKLIEKLLQRDDVEHVINACDAGREGELIFAYLYEAVLGVSPTDPNAPKPVERLWISSMTKTGDSRRLRRVLRPGDQLEPLELAARARSEADWLVGMNATRAATIRGRAWVGGVVSLGRVQTPTLAIIVRREREIQAFVPEPYWLVHATFDPRYEGLWFDPVLAADKETATGDETRIKEEARAERDRLQGRRQDGHRRDGRAQGALRARAAALRPHVAPARCEQPLRLLRAPHACRLRSRCTRARRRSPIRARTRASSPATSSRR